MSLGGNKRGKFFMFSEDKEESRRYLNRIILPDGDKADGWWQFMEAVHVVANIELIPPIWLKGK